MIKRARMGGAWIDGERIKDNSKMKRNANRVWIHLIIASAFKAPIATQLDLHMILNDLYRGLLNESVLCILR